LVYVDTSIHSYLQYIDYSTEASAIKGTYSTSLGQIDATQLYNLQVVCDINPTSTADYCEVFVYGPDSVTSKYYMYVYDHYSTVAFLNQVDMALITYTVDQSILYVWQLCSMHVRWKESKGDVWGFL